MRRPWSLAALALALTLASGCGAASNGPGGAASGGGGAGATVVVNNIVIAFTRDPDELPFDPRAARLQAATQQLTAIAGHPVTFQFDIALLPQWRSSFENALIDSIEQVARDLAALKDRRPDVFAFGDPAFERVESRYVAVLPDDAQVFDLASRTLRLALTSEASTFVREGTVFRALEGAYWDMLEGKFRSADPDSVADVGHYFDYLTGYRHSDPDDEARAATAWKVARVFPRIPAPRRDDALKWLAGRAGFFEDGYRQGTPRGPMFQKAEKEWAGWLRSNLDALDEHDRYDVVSDLAVERRDRQQGDTYYRHEAFPDVDFMGLGLQVVDRWVAAGRPMRNEDHPKDFLFLIFFACPGPRDADGHHRSFFACDHALYRYAADTPADLDRLTKYLLARKDPTLVEAAFINLVRVHEDYPQMLTLWRALESQAPLWEMATRLVAEQVSEVQDQASLLDEAQRQWRALPAEHGPVLYLVSQLEHERYGAVSWKDFARTFGDAVTQAEFAAFLDQGDDALWNAHEVWPALSRGWSRAAPLVARLDGFVDRARAQQMLPHATDAIGRIVTRMCEEKAAGDLAQLHAWAQRRSAARASEQKDLETIVYKTTPGKCAED
jgi:hypothetical protein